MSSYSLADWEEELNTDSQEIGELMEEARNENIQSKKSSKRSRDRSKD